MRRTIAPVARIPARLGELDERAERRRYWRAQPIERKLGEVEELRRLWTEVTGNPNRRNRTGRPQAAPGRGCGDAAGPRGLGVNGGIVAHTGWLTTRSRRTAWTTTHGRPSSSCFASNRKRRASTAAPGAARCGSRRAARGAVRDVGAARARSASAPPTRGPRPARRWSCSARPRPRSNTCAPRSSSIRPTIAPPIGCSRSSSRTIRRRPPRSSRAS